MIGELVIAILFIAVILYTIWDWLHPTPLQNYMDWKAEHDVVHEGEGNDC